MENTARAEGRHGLREKGLSEVAVPRIKIGKFVCLFVCFVFTGESDQSRRRKLQIEILGDLLVKQLSEAASQPAPSCVPGASSQCFTDSLLNVSEQPRPSRQRERGLGENVGN